MLFDKLISKNNVRSNCEIQNVITKHEYFTLYNAFCVHLESHTAHVYKVSNQLISSLNELNIRCIKGVINN
jgi:hypothetical protein